MMYCWCLRINMREPKDSWLLIKPSMLIGGDLKTNCFQKYAPNHFHLPHQNDLFFLLKSKNQTSLILSRLRPRTVYIVQIQTLGSRASGRERESPPATHYFYTYDDVFLNNGSSNSMLFVHATEQIAT